MSSKADSLVKIAADADAKAAVKRARTAMLAQMNANLPAFAQPKYTPSKADAATHRVCKVRASHRTVSVGCTPAN